jgi:hypothetical protein
MDISPEFEKKTVMRTMKYVLAIWTVAVVTLLVACSSEKKAPEQKTASESPEKRSAASAQALTAKEAIAVAQQAALQRTAGAYLVHIDSQQGKAQADGKADAWEFRYYDPTKDDEFGEVRKVRRSGGGYRKRIPEGWIDSQKAAQAAKDQCQDAPERSHFFMLLATADGQSAKWGISCEQVQQRRYIMVDAFSGEVLSIKDSW